MVMAMVMDTAMDTRTNVNGISFGKITRKPTKEYVFQF